MTVNPKTIGLCIVLFLASALITLSLQQTSQSNARVVPAHRKGAKVSVATTQQNVLKEHKVAFATFLAGDSSAATGDDGKPLADVNDDDDGYFVGTRVLAYQLLHSKSAGTNNSIPFIVLCTRDVSKRKREKLRKDGATVIIVEKLDNGWVQGNNPRWADVMTKLRLFQLTEYAKICFIDADMLVTAPLDGVFFDEATLTQSTGAIPDAIQADEAQLPRTYMFATHADYWGYEHPYPPAPDMTYLNCGFFVFTPSRVLFDYYVSLSTLR